MLKDSKINDTKDVNVKNEEATIGSTEIKSFIADEGINFEAEEANSMSGPYIVGITMID
jgi:hypothetical protein